MAFIKALELTKAEIKYFVNPISISVRNILSINIFIIFSSFIRLLKDLKVYFFLISILIGLGFYFIKSIW